MPIFLFYYKKKMRTFFLYWFSIGSILGLILFILLKNGCFDYRTIARKYCYFYNKHDLTGNYRDVLITNDKENELMVVEYYKKLLDTCNKSTTIQGPLLSPDFSGVHKFFIVDVLEYSADSLLAKIRVNWNGSTDRNSLTSRIGYVPIFTLYDTLPPIVKDTMKINNWSKKSREE